MKTLLDNECISPIAVRNKVLLWEEDPLPGWTRLSVSFCSRCWYWFGSFAWSEGMCWFLCSHTKHIVLCPGQIILPILSDFHLCFHFIVGRFCRLKSLWKHLRLASIFRNIYIVLARSPFMGQSIRAYSWSWLLITLHAFPFKRPIPLIFVNHFRFWAAIENMKFANKVGVV